jgi:TM2 domain-containing membrane protein YozV
MNIFKSIIYLPMFLLGGLGIGRMVGGNFKQASILLLCAWVVAVINRFIDILTPEK